MPVFIASLLGGLLNMAASLVGRVMLSLGIAAVTYTGLAASITYLKDSAIAQILSLPPMVLQVLSLLKVGQGLSIIFAAVAVSLAMRGMSGDTFKRWTK